MSPFGSGRASAWWVLACVVVLAACSGRSVGVDPGSAGASGASGAGPSCPEGQLACGSTCTDPEIDPSHCGACESACGSLEICDQGRCTPAAQGCANGLSVCGGGCVDTRSSNNDCGQCGHACPTDQSCQGGQCQCSSGLTLCGTSCVDTQSNNTNCGGCGAACPGDRSCSAGQCLCAAGQADCGGTCTDVQNSTLDCGSCGHACALGERCSAGLCGGGPGPDGCSGLAQNLSVSAVQVYQTVAIPIMQGGAEVAPAARNADVVSGRPTLFRVLVTVGAGWGTRGLSARVYLQNPSSVDTYFSKATIAASSADAALNNSFSILVPADKITSDTRYAVEVVECGSGAGAVQSPRFPSSDGVALGARDTGTLKVRLIPVLSNAMLPDTSAAALAVYQNLLLAMYPISSLELSVGDTISVTDATDWSGNLDLVRAKRQADAPADDVYYYGMIKPAATLRAFCGTGCTTGIGFVVGTGRNAASTRAAIGIAFADASSAETMAHEVGHNHGRNHSPCVTPGGTISGIDASYPYAGGLIGVLGFDDRTTPIALLPTTRSDIMGYCNNKWISDYTYAGLVERVASVNAAQSVFIPAEALGTFEVLIVDASGPRWGVPIRELSAPAGDAEPAEILDQNGNLLETIDVYRTEIAELGGASIEVPRRRPGWDSVRLRGAPALGSGGPITVRLP